MHTCSTVHTQHMKHIYTIHTCKVHPNPNPIQTLYSTLTTEYRVCNSFLTCNQSLNYGPKLSTSTSLLVAVALTTPATSVPKAPPPQREPSVCPSSYVLSCSCQCPQQTRAAGPSGGSKTSKGIASSHNFSSDGSI